MLNIKMLSTSFLIFGFVLLEMPDFIKAPSGNYYEYYGLDYDNMDNSYKYDENSLRDVKRYADDVGYNTDEFKDEEDDDGGEKNYPEFSLKKGKKALIDMLEDIETNYLSTDSEDELKFGNINAARNIDSLISAGNDCLSSDQDQELLDLDKDDRKMLRGKLAGFLNRFEAKLIESGFGNTPGPLTYLWTRLNNSLKNSEEEEEDDYSD